MKIQKISQLNINHLIPFVSRNQISIFIANHSSLVAVHLTSAGKLIMVLGGLHRRISDVPDTIPYVTRNIHL